MSAGFGGRVAVIALLAAWLGATIIVGAVVLIANGHRTESVETTSRLEPEVS